MQGKYLTIRNDNTSSLDIFANGSVWDVVLPVHPIVRPRDLFWIDVGNYGFELFASIITMNNITCKYHRKSCQI